MRAVAYFHADHFEPWRLAPGSDVDMERRVEDILAYVNRTASLDFARKASLFYEAAVNPVLASDRELRRANPEDRLGFLPPSAREQATERDLLAPLAASPHELQVKLRHDAFTYVDTPGDPEISTYLQTPRGRSFDNARLELALRLALNTLREDGGLDPARWFFIHGNGALNASDPHECTVVREIEILQRNGCLGDFTQPSARPHADSRIEVPYLVDPVASAKGFDMAQASPAPAAGAGEAARDRFFIWASASSWRCSSIDTSSPFVRARVKNPRATALERARTSLLVGDVLFLKTHCHSLDPAYWIKGGPPIPHADSGVQAELRALFDAADAVGIDVEFLTVGEAYERILGAPPSPADERSPQFDLGQGSPMASFGLTVDHTDSRGARSAPPPLGPKAGELPPPSVAVMPAASSDAPGEALPPVPHVVPIRRFGGASDRPVAEEALLDAAKWLPELLAAPDVRLINATGGRIASVRASELGAEGSGVSGFYGPRAAEQTLLQSSELLCTAFVAENLPGAHAVYEIGCGLGVLSTLLALRGFRAVGVERNGARLSTAELIADAVVSEWPASVRPPLFVNGTFPKAPRKAARLAASVALITNLLGTASAEQQERFVAGLRDFGAVLIDVRRFYVRRQTRRQMREVEELFTLGGFDAPRLAFDLGREGRFLLFTNPRPHRRPGVEAALVSLGLALDEPLFVTP